VVAVSSQKPTFDVRWQNGARESIISVVELPSPEHRISDEDRRAIADALTRAYADGRISIETLELRLEQLGGDLLLGDALELARDVPAPLTWKHRLAGLERQLRKWFSPDTERDRPAELRPDSLETQDKPGAGVIIGRAVDCDVVLSDPSVSRHHAFVRRDPEGWRMIDLRSTNGTRLNGLQVRVAKLRDGDLLRMGRTELLFRA
jgi:hypothetical protein